MESDGSGVTETKRQINEKSRENTRMDADHAVRFN